MFPSNIRLFCSKIKQTRKLLLPQKIISTPLQQHYHITSQNYDFLLNTNPSCTQIYVHNSDTPSKLLSKNAIHIFPQSVNNQTMHQKFKAHLRRLQQNYKKSYDNCQTPRDIFHLERKIKTQIRIRTKYIGRILGKFRHYNLFKSIHQIDKEKTQEQFKKKGLSVHLLGKNRIYPSGPVWLPTSDAYLKLVQQYLNHPIESVPKRILDLGCGCGHYKQSKICAVDINKYAVDTCLTNAASLGLKNIQSFESDIRKTDNFQFQLKQHNIINKFDLIISNPPWLIAKKLINSSQILDGVYDQQGKFLSSIFYIAGKMLNGKNAKFVLIYSDLSKNLGLEINSVQELSKKNNMLILQKLEVDYPRSAQKQSALTPYKLKSKIFLYQICKSL